MKTSLRILCVCIILLFLIACGKKDPQQTPAPTAVPAPEPAETPVPTEPPAEEAVVEIIPEPQTPAPTAPPVPEPTEASAPADTPEPVETPAPTEAPAPVRTPKEGDIAVHFPDYDTGADADYSYQSDEIRIAITVHHESLPDHTGRMLNETYYVADIWIRNINSIHMGFANGVFDTGTEEGDTLAKRENAILATNGCYYQGYLLKDGQVYRKQRQNKGWNSGATGLIYKDGTLKTFYLSNEVFNSDREIKNGALFGWQFGPIVIRNYEEGPGATKYHNMGFKARNILGYYEPGHYVVVTCDNRGDDAQGMNEYMMVDLMKSLGVKDAFNLDGGTSAVLVFMGEVINHPTLRNDNGSLVEGRPIGDMLLFGEPGEDGAFVDLSALTAAKGN